MFIQQAILADNEIYFPLRSLLNAFGVNVAWDQAADAAIITVNEKDYLLHMDLDALSVNLDKDSVFPLKMLNSRLYIPLSLIKAILNYDLSWDTENRTLNAVSIPGSSTILKNLPEAPEFKVVDTFTGVASWYGGKFSGRKTNSGEIFDENELTAAHRTLPFNTYVRVTFLKTNKAAIVRINDRGPHIAGRILDLSKAAAEEIGLRPHGLGTVKVEVLANYEKDG